MEVEDPNISYGDLADCSGFETLDMKLSAAISLVANNGLFGREIVNREKLDARKRMILSSRQLLHIIYQRCVIDADKSRLHQVRDFSP